ncbi:hypothetical protein [Engelhardtia mirabilis]|uniref:Beta-lactamase hydrolase-like protein n=1 Tax=Engelhardtia mirabilis TaxID=2528011 RepID=A0A518BSH8_9BACT|nr:hypothetical protein Pla133_50490 [Planctomycetes bacterium Pla133]QDV04251.1 hypothetical protein Pla86_50460 [Planctomycetes bacterium Pla86]
MKLHARRYLLPLLCLALGGCGLFGFGRSDEPQPELYDAVTAEPLPGDVRCFLCGDLYLAANLTPDNLDVLERRGVVTLIDLRPADVIEPLLIRALQLGLRPVSLPVDQELPTDAQVDRVLAEIALERDGLLLLTCQTGSRSAIFFAIYRSVVDAVPVEIALEQARSAGMKPGAPEKLVRDQVERLGGVGAQASSTN